MMGGVIMSNFDPEKVRVKRTVYKCTFMDNTVQRALCKADFTKQSKKGIRKIESQTVFYTCPFSKFEKIARIEK